MAYYKIKLYANSLNRHTTFEMFIPNDIREDIPHEDTIYGKRKMKALFLLHGYTGSADNWVPEYLAEKYNFAVIIPNGENSFWLDGLSTGHKFCSFIGEELVNYIRKTFCLAMNSDETYIMGLSMGGFGALHTAFTYPETFGKTAAMSSALIVHEVAKLKEGEDNGVANYYYYRECFGDLEKVESSDNNPEVLVKRLKDEGKTIPEILMCCGTEDFLLENNRQMHSYLDSIGVNHKYYESKGNHDMNFWDEYVVKFIEMMFGENNNE